MISQAKKNFYEIIDNHNFRTLKHIISEDNASLTQILNVFSHDNILPLLKENIDPREQSVDETYITNILVHLIKEGFIYLTKNHPAFLTHCQKSDDAIDIFNSIFIDPKTSETDIIFLYTQSLFSPEKIGQYFFNHCRCNNIETKEISTLLHLDNILKDNEYYLQTDKQLIIKDLSERLAENLLYGDLRWQDIITSPLNEFLKFSEHHFKYFLMNHRRFFERQFTYLEKEDLNLILETVPSLIGNQQKWLIEILIEHYEDISDLQDDDAQTLIEPDCLKLIMDKTSVSLNEKIQILYRLLNSMDQFIFFANRQGVEMRDFSPYKDGVKLLISDIEKEVILSQCMPLSTDIQTMKKRI